MSANSYADEYLKVIEKGHVEKAGQFYFGNW